jgi:hypothetical protein
MARSNTLPITQIYDWSSGHHRAIRLKLRERREQIAELLQIDLEEMRSVPIPKPAGDVSDRSFDAYVEQRKSYARIDSVPIIDLILDEIEGFLCRFVMNVFNLNGQASQPAIRKVLIDIAARDAINEREIEDLDLGIREYLADNYVGHRDNFCPGTVKSDLVIETAKLVLKELPQPRVGRPGGTTNAAAKELMREILFLYRTYSPNPPTRSVLNQKDQGGIIQQKESGRFLKFCKCVTAALPTYYHDQVTRSGGGIATLVRETLYSS